MAHLCHVAKVSNRFGRLPTAGSLASRDMYVLFFRSRMHIYASTAGEEKTQFILGLAYLAV